MTPKRSTKSALLPWLDVALAAVLGFVLYFPLGKSDLGEIAWIVTAIVAASRVAMSIEIQSQLEPVERLAEAFGLRSEEHDRGLRRLITQYDRVTVPELRTLRDEMLSETVQRLQRLADTETSDLLDPAYFYEWMDLMLQRVAKGEVVRAVSTMLPSEWDSSPLERRFLDANVAAARRGVEIHRLFVVSEADKAGLDTLDVVKAHQDRRNAHLHGYVVTRETLEATDPGLLGRLGDGFIAFGKRAVMLDHTVPPNHAKGIISVHNERVSALARAFDQASAAATAL